MKQDAPDDASLLNGGSATNMSTPFTRVMAIFHPDGFWPLVAIKEVTGPDGKKASIIHARDFPPSSARAADAEGWADAHVAEGFSIYLSVNRIRKPLGKKAEKNDIVEVTHLFVDCDPPKELSGEKLERWRRDKIQELQTGSMSGKPASLIMDSGRGVWGFWGLVPGIAADGAKGAVTRHVEECGRWLEIMFGADDCRNIERVARLPGFLNPRTGRIAKIIEYHPERVYQIEDFPRERIYGAGSLGGRVPGAQVRR